MNDVFPNDLEISKLLKDVLTANALFKVGVQMRRFHANQQRVEANREDDVTDLAIEEHNEQTPVPLDYEPVLPEDAPDETEPGEDEEP